MLIMEDKITQLYSEAIMKLNREPFHFERYDTAQHIIEAYNPLCGDKFKLFLDIEDGIISKAFFYGYGCAVSKASTSVLISQIMNQPISEAISIIGKFLNWIQYDANSSIENKEAIEADWQVFSSVKNFPERMTCVTLSWGSSKKFLIEHQ